MASSRTRRPQIRLLLGACWALGLFGCQVVFGEYKAGPGSAGGGALPTGGNAVAGGGASAGTAGSSGGVAGAAGSPRGGASTGGSGNDCNGTQPFRCQQDASLQACQGGVWTTIDTCTRLALCQPALGVCDFCADGERECTGSALSVCDAGHTAFTTIDTCQSPLYCDTTADHCVACEPNQARCNGDYLAVCNADRSAWDLQAQSCPLGCQGVDGTADYCADCPAGSPSACTSSVTLRSCISGRWKATACPNGCLDATSTTPAACVT